MLEDYISYKLKSYLEEINIDLIHLTTYSNKVEYYKSNRCNELYLPNNIIAVETYLSFYENKLLAITYNTSQYNLNYLIKFINSFASSQDEFLFEDVLGGNSDLFCIQNGIAIHLNNRTDSTIDFKIAVPINERKNKVFV
ncbi:hypothetical protein [Tenacibaculum soleae]|uniref:hypothetical protein n=1 Tax=Tenacibaculum soleae TaxID=447689 RepID=UPI00230038D4|nr:hypothetical protein [Tenacibaculum soleae]